MQIQIWAHKHTNTNAQKYRYDQKYQYKRTDIQMQVWAHRNINIHIYVCVSNLHLLWTQDILATFINVRWSRVGGVIVDFQHLVHFRIWMLAILRKWVGVAAVIQGARSCHVASAFVPIPCQPTSWGWGGVSDLNFMWGKEPRANMIFSKNIYWETQPSTFHWLSSPNLTGCHPSFIFRYWYVRVNIASRTRCGRTWDAQASHLNKMVHGLLPNNTSF